MSLDYDVIVVGAGPAGSTSAKYAAQGSAKVLLVERKIDVGVPQKCGEMLPTVDQMKKLMPDARGVEELFNVHSRFVVNRTKHVEFFFPGNFSKRVSFDSNILERKIFDHRLADEAVRTGSDLMISTHALALLEGNHGVVLRNERGEVVRARAKALIDAGGALSMIAKAAGLRGRVDPLDIGIGLQYEMSRVDMDEEVIEMYFGKEYTPGAYAWIIPKGDGIANVGISLRHAYMERGVLARDYLTRFIRKHPIASKRLGRAAPIAIKNGVVPVGGPMERTVSGNVLLVGDAASQALAHVGGGIPSALICGKIAGEAAASYVKGSESLSSYESRWRNVLGKVLKDSLRLRKMGDIFFKSDKLTEFILNRGWATEEMLMRFVDCRVDRKIMLAERMLRATKI